MIIASHNDVTPIEDTPVTRRGGSSLRRTRAKTPFALRRKTHTRHDRLTRSSPNVDRPPLAIARSTDTLDNPV